MEDRILQLIAALRGSGVRVSLAESAEAFSAVDLMGVKNRLEFWLCLRTTLIKNARDLPIFDRLFPLFFGSGQPPNVQDDLSDNFSPEDAQKIAEAIRELVERMRQNLERLMKGKSLSREELEQLAKMIGLNDIDDLHYQNWMADRMQQALEFPEVRDAIRQLMEQLAQAGFTNDQLEDLRGQLLGRLNALQEQISQFAGERIAENLSRRNPAELADNLMERPFQSLSEEEKRLLMIQVKRLANQLRTRIALRQKRAKTGHLDAKATIRANLKHQGVPMEIRHRDRARKPRLVILCDVSTSMRFCSELMLGFIFALQGLVRKTHAFAFIDHLEYISDEFAGQDGNVAIASVLHHMPAGSYNTDLGRSLYKFNEDYLDTLNGQTTLILVGDGRNNYNDPRFDIFKLMAGRASRTLWFNPEALEMWGSGDSDMPGYAVLCDSVFKVSNLAELSMAVDHLMVA